MRAWRGKLRRKETIDNLEEKGVRRNEPGRRSWKKRKLRKNKMKLRI